MTPEEAIQRRDRLRLTAKRLIFRTRCLLDELEQMQSDESMDQAESRLADYWRRWEAVKVSDAMLQEIVDRGDAVQH